MKKKAFGYILIAVGVIFSIFLIRAALLYLRHGVNERTDVVTESTTEAGTDASTESGFPFVELLGANSATVHIIDVGQGNAILIQDHGHNLLYDCGNYDTSDYLVKYLRKQGVISFDYVVLSHYDADHCAAAPTIFEKFIVSSIIEPDYEHDTETYEHVMEAQRFLDVKHPSIGDTYMLGDGIVTVICPTDYDFEEGNNNSVGIRYESNGHSILLTGDAEVESEYDFLEYDKEHDIELDSDIYLAGHHGSNSSSTNSLLDAVSPEIAVISVGKDNEYGHPKEEVLERLKEHGAEIYRTDEQGTIVFDFTGEEITQSNVAK